jgi:hypothetical protein
MLPAPPFVDLEIEATLVDDEIEATEIEAKA